MRSLSDDLRERTPEQLAELFAARPDLLHPAPRDLTALAGAVNRRASVAAALAGYNQFELLVALAAAIWPQPVDVARISRALGRPASGPVLRMYREALAWGPPDQLRVSGEVRQILLSQRARPALAPLDPQVRGYAENPELVTSLLAEAPAGCAQALETLLDGANSGPHLGKIANARRQVTTETARTPIEWLLAHHLVVPVGSDTVIVPAEVAEILATDSSVPPRIVSATPPLPLGQPVAPAAVDSAALSPALRFVHTVEQLLLLWADDPAPEVQSGGIGVRARRAAGKALGVSAEEVDVAIDVAAAAGLLARTWEARGLWLPSPAFDHWLEAPLTQRWVWLAIFWPGSQRNGALPTPALPEIRRLVLQMLADSPAPPDPQQTQEQLMWLAPLRWSAEQQRLAELVIAEAETLGISALRAVSSAGQAVLSLWAAGAAPAGAESAVGAMQRAQADPALGLAVERWFPAAVDELVVQADLSAIVPGPATPQLAQLLRATAVCEAFDVASTYRFTRESVAAALAAGMTATDLRQRLARHSSRPLPQGLEVLIDDVARGYGTLRAGAAGAYLRSDDPALLAALLANPRLSELQLSQIAPTVLISSAEPEELVAQLRAVGATVAPESAGGQLLRVPPRRAAVHRGFPTEPAATPELIAAAVQALQVGSTDGRYRTEPPHIPDLSAPSLVATLRAAIGTELWISYDSGYGLVEPLLVSPLRIVGGHLQAHDKQRGVIDRFALARIAGALRPSS